MWLNINKNNFWRFDNFVDNDKNRWFFLFLFSSIKQIEVRYNHCLSYYKRRCINDLILGESRTYFICG